ncbi:MAG: hypothetical protein JRJ06_04285, partial [Deltaproteobacteria bacterium]|nr:hypothetical protein [Deltaproteobacteria bacterium]
MPFSINAEQRVAFILSLSILIISCATPLVQEREHISPLRLDLEDNRPKSVVIMPFDNETAEAGIEILFRKSFYNHFSSKNYRDIELSEVDRALKFLRSDPSRSWRECPMADLERLLHADYLIFGKVTYFKKIFLGIYS